jgi:hypothetical protein
MVSLNFRLLLWQNCESPWERWTDEVVEDFKTVGLRNWHAVTRDWKE